jgi:hypothetical protein
MRSMMIDRIGSGELDRYRYVVARTIRVELWQLIV